MDEGILRWFRERVRTREFVVTVHAEEEMAADGFTIFDVERAILTGSIMVRQRDRNTGERKYLIRGETVLKEIAEVVAKQSPTGRMVIITVYKP